MPDRKPRTSSSDIEAAGPQVKELYESGKTIRQISEEVGFSRESVRRSLRDSGVKILDRGTGRPRKSEPKKTLSDEELEKLRNIVGFDPNKSFGRGIRVQPKEE